MITPHGEVDVETDAEGKHLYYPLKTEELKPLPPSFRISHGSELELFHSILMYIKKHQPNRNMPVTRNEFLKSGADPHIIKALEDFGLLRAAHVPLRNREGQNTGSRACYYYTDQGRAYIRSKLDPSYALTDFTDPKE